MGGAPGASCICCGGAPGIARPGGGAPGIVRPGGGSGGAEAGDDIACEKPGLACWSGCASGTAPTVHISSSATEAGAETGDDIGACASASSETWASASSETWASASSENGDAANPASGGVGAGPGAAVGGGGFILH